ncbi:MAG TPA: ribosome-associated translation inhibitor RaiA [Candidatus Paceibacterota bacterium]|jgi:putative sigma-54 modulation protein|nr:ribosome-associated translation inhibitor RaiA [Candidatus Paceibacterota bacterium]
MQINLQGKNMKLTDAIKKYVSKRAANLQKLLSAIEKKGGEISADFEIGKSTNHHKGGYVFHAHGLIKTNGQEFYSSADEEDVYTAIDVVEESLFREISKDKDRTQTLFKRGAVSVKKMLKGLSKRNPFTSKY